MSTTKTNNVITTSNRWSNVRVKISFIFKINAQVKDLQRREAMRLFHAYVFSTAFNLLQHKTNATFSRKQVLQTKTKSWSYFFGKQF